MSTINYKKNKSHTMKTAVVTFELHIKYSESSKNKEDINESEK